MVTTGGRRKTGKLLKRLMNTSKLQLKREFTYIMHMEKITQLIIKILWIAYWVCVLSRIVADYLCRIFGGIFGCRIYGIERKVTQIFYLDVIYALLGSMVCIRDLIICRYKLFAIIILVVALLNHWQ